jgi:hypothetical protein
MATCFNLSFSSAYSWAFFAAATAANLSYSAFNALASSAAFSSANFLALASSANLFFSVASFYF